MTHRKISVSLLALTAALSLSACAGNAESAPTPAPPTASTTTSEEARPTDPSQCKDPAFASSHEDFCFGGAGDPFSGPASEKGVFLNGVEVRVVKATKEPMPSTMAGSANPGDDTLITVTTEFRNAGTETYVFFDKRNVRERLYHGVNVYEAKKWASTGGNSNFELPAQLVPGTAAMTVSRFTLPASGLDKLDFHASPNFESMPTYTFLDVQALIK